MKHNYLVYLMVAVLSFSLRPPAHAGILTASKGTQPAALNLHAEGTTDWSHWGLTASTDFNRKSGASIQISNITKIGTGTINRYTDGTMAASWTGGTPTATATSTKAGIYVAGVGNGFQISIPADTTSRILKVYCGVWKAQGKLEASLSDASAPAILDASHGSTTGSSNTVYTIRYQANSAAQTLTVKWSVQTSHDTAGAGTVGWQAASLAPNPNNAPTVSISNPADNSTFTEPATLQVAANASDSDGIITEVQFLSGTTSLGIDATSPYSITWASIARGTYSLTARATDNGGGSTVSSPVRVSVQTPTAVPPAPTGVIATAANGSFTIQWNPVTGATSYNVYMAEEPGVRKSNYSGLTGGHVHYTVDSPYTHSSLANGTTYFAVVTAVNDAGESVDSIEVNATPNAPLPSAPTGVVATAGNGSFTVSWNPVVGATSYNIYMAEETGVRKNNYSSMAGGHAHFTVDSPYTHSSLLNGVMYYAVITAINDSGEGPDSAEVQAMPAAPNVAPSVSITSPASGSTFIAPANVIFNATANDSDGTVTKFDFLSGSTLLGTDSTSPYSLGWNNVSSGNYSITARATDNSGTSTTSSAVQIAVTASSTVTTTLNPIADAYVRDGTSATSNFGTATDLQIKNDAVGNNRRTFLKFDVSTAGSNVMSAKLRLYGSYQSTSTPGAVLGYSVTTDTWTETAITWNTQPATGTSLGSVTVTATTQYWEWDVTSFVQSEKTAGQTLVSLALQSDNATGSHVQLNAREASANKPQLVVTTGGGTVNNPPTVSITAPANGTTYLTPATISMAVAASDSDGSVTKVDFYSGTSLIGADSSSPYQFTWNNVASGSYVLSAKATDNGAAATTSATVNVIVNSSSSANTAPAAPSNLAATSSSCSSMSLSWNDNSNNESSFKIERSTSSTTGFVQVDVVGAGVNAYLSTGLNVGTTYYFRVRANNSAGDSAYSNAANATTLATCSSDPAGSTVLSATGIKAGLSVRVGTTDGQLETELTNGGRILVHGITTSETVAQNARNRIMTSPGVYGLVSVERVISFNPLPYADNLVNLLVADIDALGVAAPTDVEINRVLSPNGVSYLKKNNVWVKTVKARSSTMDDWSHFWKGPDRTNASQDNFVKPHTGIQWQSGTQTMWEKAMNGFRVSDSRALYVWRVNGTDLKYRLSCRDPFNGVGHWDIELTGHNSYYKQGPLAVGGGKVFYVPGPGTPLAAADLATGAKVLDFVNGGVAGTSPTEMDIVYDNGVIYQGNLNVLYALDANTGSLKWKYTAATGKYMCLITAAPGQGKVFALVSDIQFKTGRNGYGRVSKIICLNSGTGQTIWENTSSYAGNDVNQLMYYDQALYVYTITYEVSVTHQPVLIKLRASDGQEIWREDKTTITHWAADGWDVNKQASELSGLNNFLYTMHHSGRKHDVLTGDSLKFVVSGGWGARCAMSHAAKNYLITSGMNYIDLNNDMLVKRNELTRPNCASATLPANGLVYSLPSRCACAFFMRGFMALSSEPVKAPLSDSVRLQQGSVTVPANSGVTWPKANEWPIFLGNPQRTGSGGTTLASTLRLLWSSQVAPKPPVDDGAVRNDWRLTSFYNGPVTAPVIADNTVFVSVKDQHRIEAYDGTIGTKKWQYIAGARVETPPTIYDGMCIFGCRDGWVYGLRASDGKLVWRFLAAPYERKSVGYSQLESTWPVHGTVSIANGNVVVTAGWHIEANGGIHIYKLNPYTGALKWKNIWGRARNWVINGGVEGTQTGQKQELVSRCKNQITVANGQYVMIPGLLIDALNDSLSTNNVSGPMGRYVSFGNTGSAYPFFNDSMEDWDGPGGPSGGVWSLKNSSGVSGNRVAFIGGKGFEIQAAPLALNCLDPVNGTVLWTASLPTSYNWSSMIAIGDKVYVAGDNRRSSIISLSDASGELRVFSISAGTLLQTISLPYSPIDNGMAAANNRLYITLENGQVACFGQ